MVAQTASYPMEKMGCDLFNWKDGDYVAIVDRYSSFIWCKKLIQTKTENVTNVLLNIFEEYGFPNSIKTDNGPSLEDLLMNSAISGVLNIQRVVLIIPHLTDSQKQR